MLIVAEMNGKGKEKEQQLTVVLCRSPELTEKREKEVSGLLCSSAVTENSTTTDLFRDVVGMTGCVGDQQVAGGS